MVDVVRLIDADALCEFFEERYKYLRNASETPMPGGYVCVDTEIQCGAIIAKEFLDKAKNAPTIEPESLRPKGRWRKRGNEKNCSVCKFIYYSNNDDFNYCPNCGAKMEG